MKMRTIYLLLSVSLVGCGYMRSLFTDRVPVEDDRSIVFPRFYEHVPVEVGAGNEPYEMDGEMLRALMIAANDYIPPDARDLACPSKRESQYYRVIRQGNIIFVYIHENPAYCGRQYPVRHEGGKYAISADGRILRRLIGDQPEGPIKPETPDDSGRWIEAEPGDSSEFDAIHNSPRDGGTVPSSQQSPTAPLPAPDGGSPIMDGGSSGVHAE